MSGVSDPSGATCTKTCSTGNRMCGSSAPPDWTRAIDVGDVTTVDLDIARDNVELGIRAIDSGGHRSPIGFPVAAA